MSIRQVSPELQKRAKKELSEDVKRVPKDIEYIRNWLKQTKYINARTDDQWILSFLRGCKFSLEKTKQKLDTYYTMRTLLPEFYKNRDPMLPEIQRTLEAGCLLPLPNTEGPDTHRIMLLRGGSADPSKISTIDIFKTNMMIMDILLLEDDHYMIPGTHMIQDMKNVTMAHMPPPSTIKKAMSVFQDASPVRPKTSHFINIPSFFEAIWGVFKVFLKDKMKKRMFVHASSNLDDLYKVVPQKLLPTEYGGEAGSLAEITAFWKNKVESYRDWLLDDEQYCTDETKRPGKPKTSDEYFGIEGSFRKLEFD